jgi:hypothetical protein
VFPSIIFIVLSFKLRLNLPNKIIYFILSFAEIFVAYYWEAYHGLVPKFNYDYNYLRVLLYCVLLYFTLHSFQSFYRKWVQKN